MKSFDCKQCKVAADRSIFLTNLFKKLFRDGKEQSIEATVLSRRLASARFPTQGNTWDHWVKFSLADGREIEVIVPEEVFRDLPDAQKGTLTWEGETFLSFETE